MGSLKTRIAFFLVALICLPSLAQNRHVRFNHLTIYDGLSQSSINTLKQDRHGFVWLGTQDGLNRYDGNGFKVFQNQPGDPTSIADNYIQELGIDATGALWVITQNLTLNLYDEVNESFKRFRFPIKTNLQQPGTRFLCDKSGIIWIAANGLGVLRINPEDMSMINYLAENRGEYSLPDNNVTDILQDHHGEIWLASYTGLARYDFATDAFVDLPHDQDHPKDVNHRAISAMYEDDKSRLWISTHDGLDMYDKDRTTSIQMFKTAFDKLGGYSPSNQITGEEQGVWLATSNGLYFCDTKTGKVEHFTPQASSPDSLSNESLFSIMMDHARTLWIGSINGLNQLNRAGAHFTHFKNEFNNPNSLHNNFVWNLLEDDLGDIWISHDKGLDRFNKSNGTVDHFLETNPELDLPPGPYKTVQTQDRRIWLSSFEGIASFDGSVEHLTRYLHDPTVETSLSDDNVRGLTVDRANTLWAATNYGLNQLVDRDKGIFRRFFHDPNDPNTLHSNSTTTLFEDSTGTLWVGAIEGVSTIDNTRTQIRHYLPNEDDPKSISSGTISCFLEDNEERIWIGTSNGLNLKQEDGFHQFRKADGLPNNVINGILQDNLGMIWIATNRGLCRMDSRSFATTNFDVYNGLQSNEFNNSAALKSRDGVLYFGGINGFNRFNPQLIKPNPIPPIIQIASLRIFNQEVGPHTLGGPLSKPIHLTDHITLNHTQNVLTLELAALHYAHTKGNAYAYQLSGFHDEWVHLPAQRRFVTFTNLNAGTYKLKVKAANSDGIWSPTVQPLTITVEPPPWATWWAYLLYFLALLLVIYGYTRYQYIKLRRERAMNERLRLLGRMKDDFLANTSHELRTPLNGIIGIAESLLVGAGGLVNEKMAANLSMIVSSGKRLSNLVNDLLDFSKLKDRSLRLTRKPVNIYALTEVTFSLTAPLLGTKKLRLINRLNDETPLVDGDEDRLQQILLNLVGNATKFTEEGHVKVFAEVDGSWLILSVEDTGIGIPPEQFERIFESFEQLDSSSSRMAGGTGLGLAITRQLVELHGGQINITSELGVGTTFYVRLPIAGSGAIAHTETVPVPAMAVQRVSTQPIQPLQVITSGESRFRILVVDDESVNRQVLVNHLTLQNYTIEEASSGRDALRMIEKNHYDLVLLDIMMPHMDGLEVCLKIRDHFPIQELPVIFLTAKSQPADLSSGFAAGGSDYLAKPISRDELLSRVRTHLTLLDVHRNLETRVEERTRELKVAYKTLEEMSLTDPLTGLRNRRFVLKHIESDVAQTNRAYLNWIECGKDQPPPWESDLTFYLIDMDHFKSVNDTHGHGAGDEMLIQIRDLLEKAFRSSDFLVRWGGEEFLVVTRFTSRETASVMAERLRNLVANHAFDIGGGQHLHRTCSIGFATYPFIVTQPRLLSWSLVVDIADTALYAAKFSSRNAWVSIAATEHTDKEDLMRHLLSDPSEELRNNRISVESSLPAGQELVWKN